jgi:hypothetical protein
MTLICKIQLLQTAWLKKTTVYECHPDVRFLSEHQQSVNNLLGRFITVKGHIQTFTVS